ncbi:DUF1287 domain-containing protein [Neogemmobacter tilapiae]|uniref:DUF1287 domain-containing protein n=1 Tax=Neogemmobacter tilapiae TaxID=875041 RepID=A0A918TTJ6_9RHOB|nr:DUF1287 domain-containing protein [Gemmobacter tilapiae]GHC61273.1 DUF1287 domain-containing protein [Gemmobacter tilapiae]
MKHFIALTLALLPMPAIAQAIADLPAAARWQVGVTLIYDPAYVSLDFPAGDVPLDRGVCTDVIIRAFRQGLGIDLQLAVNRDMKADFAAYPANWGLKTTDRNIDHRRVPNLQKLFQRAGAELAVSSDPADFEPGDLVSYLLPGNLPHIAVVSDRQAEDGTPLILHNIGAGAREEAGLFAWEMTGHYRMNDGALEYLRGIGGLE